MNRWLVLFLIMNGLAACRTGRPPLNSNVNAPNSCVSRDGLSIVTYNTGLAPGLVPFAKARLAPVAEALAATDFDLMCLQEVWPDDYARAVVKGIRQASGDDVSVYSTDTRGLGETGQDLCTQREFDFMANCARDSCQKLGNEELAGCVMRECRLRGFILYQQARPCLNCLIATVGESLPDVERICVSRKGASRVYGGSNGVMLISRLPLRNVETVSLRSSGANRVALLATVDAGARGTFEVACTHLSSQNVVSPTYPGFSDWEEEQTDQVRAISERLSARAGTTGRQIFIGDLNTSWEHGINQDNQVGVWKEILRLGFRSAEDQRASFCSSCADNELRDSESNCLIDHVLLRQPADDGRLSPVCVERLYDGYVTIRSPTGLPLQTRLSDHYGLRVILR